MRPVLLFNVGIVVFLVWSSPNEVNLLGTLIEVCEEIVIEELVAVVPTNAICHDPSPRLS